MPLQATSSRNLYLFSPRQGDLFIPDQNAALLKDFHACDETFSLETVVDGNEGYGLFMRFPYGDSGVRTRLLDEFGAVTQSNNVDWLRIRRTDYAVVRTVTLSRDSVLSIASDSPDNVRHRWRDVLGRMFERANDGSIATLGIRVLLKPARPGWQARFQNHAPSDAKDAAALRVARQWAAKASGLAFQAELQLVATCKDVGERKRRSAAAVDELAKLVVELAGGEKVWTLRARRQSVGQRLARDRNNRMQSTFDPWPPLDFLSADRQLRHVLSPEEAAPLWLAEASPPVPVAVDSVLSARRETDKETGLAQLDRLPPLEEVIAKPREIALDEMHEATGISGPGVGQAVAAQSHRDVGAEGRGAAHSSRPPGLPVRRMPDRKTMRRGSGSTRRRGSSRMRDESERASPARIRDLGLTAIDIEIFGRLGDMPLASRQDLAYAAGRGIATVYKSINRFRELQLVANERVYINGNDEERFWIPEDQWDLIMGDLQQRHTQNLVKRLWLNPESLAAVYSLTGILTLDGSGRELCELSWLWRRPFDAVAQFSDGWVAFVWVGVWQDQERLDRRLQECWNELGRWSGRGERRWPGRIFFLVPNAWVCERVWRAVVRRNWEASCATLTLDNQELSGDLGLEDSVGTIPPAIREEPPSLRADVQRLIGLLTDDPGSRMRRLMTVVEMNPGILSSHLARMTGISGSLTKRALARLEDKKMVRRVEDGGFAVNDSELAMAARRDRVWLGLPLRRHGDAKVRAYSKRRRKRLGDATRILSKFRASGCPIAPGWLAQDGRFKPNGVVWVDQGPCGGGWHYVLDIRHGKRESTVREALKRALSDARSDQFPILIICRDDMEELVWSLAVGWPVLTATATRVRSRDLIGTKCRVWSDFGEPAILISDQDQKVERRRNNAANDEPVGD